MKEWMQNIDFDNKSMLQIFCEHFNLTPTTLTVAMRDSLEAIWCQKEYFSKTINYEGKSFDQYDYYDLQYTCDQWWGADLMKLNKELNYEKVFRGEGDTPTEALLDLFFEAEELLDNDDLQALKDIFSDEIEKYNNQYDIKNFK